MDRNAVALVLSEIGTLLELQGENPYKSRAFLMAARAVEKTDQDLDALARSGRVESISGVGPATARVIRDLIATGRSAYYDELRAKTPDGMRELLGVPGLGARRIRQLHQRLGISSLADLERAAAEGRIKDVRGFGERSQQKLAAGAGFVRGSTGRRRVAQVLEPAGRVLGFLRALDGPERVEAAGELRRWLETVSGIDIVASVPGSASESVLGKFATMPGLASVERSGDEALGRLVDGLTIRLLCVEPTRFPTAWLLRTGSESHLRDLYARQGRDGAALTENGLLRHGRAIRPESEAAIYAALDLPWIAPELREGMGEVVDAAAGRLPDVLEPEQLRGCFHCHTTYSDGRSTLNEIAKGARERGWRYVGIADHSQAAAYAGGLSLDDIARQHDEIDRWNDAHGDQVVVLKGIEADILSDGTLDYSEHGDRVLGRFDYVVGSVHSAFSMPRAEMTRRVLRALENPHLSILAHPTGRLLLTREPYALDVEAVMEAAERRGVAVEINADPFRMDLDWRYWRASRNCGTRAAINPDAHSVRALDNVYLGATMARKGGLRAEDIVNAWELDDVLAFFRSRRA